MERRHTLGIQGKFVLSLLIVGLLPGVVGIFLTYVFTKKTIQNAIGTSFEELARESADQVDSFLHREVEDAKALAIAPQVIAAARRREALAPAIRYLRNYQSLMAPEYVSISLLDSGGEPLLTIGSPSSIPLSSRSRVPMEGVGISRLYFSSGDPLRYLIDITVPVRDGPSEWLGEIRMTIRFEKIYDAILGVKVGKTGHGMLVASDGTPLICPILPPREHLLSSPLMDTITRRTPGWAVAEDDGHGGKESIIGFAPVPLTLGMGGENFGGVAWYTFVRQDPRETFTPLLIFMGNLAVIGIGMVSLLSMFGLYIGATLVKPILDLQSWTESPLPDEAVRNGEGSALEKALSPLTQVRTGDEIEDLARAFSRMTRSNVDYQRRLIRSERLAVMGKLAAMVAHEIRNPLNAILGGAIYLKSIGGENGKERETLDLMVREIRRLDQFVSDVLTLVQEPPPRLSDIHLRPLVEESLRLVSLQGRLKDIRVLPNFPESLPKIPVDPDQVRQVILNLLTNALDAMPSGGILTLAAELNGVPSQESPGGWVHLRIGDTGGGISPEEVGRLFEPFHTTKEKGSGLGLAISRGIMDRHGGKISVDSREGEGTVLTLSFRVTEKQPA